MANNFIPMVYAVLKDKGVDTKGMKSDEAIAKYEELTGKTGRYNVANGQEDDNKEKSFINLQLFHAKDYSNWRTKSMEKSVRSHEQNINVHKDKIKNPHAYVPNWDELSQRERDGLIKKWTHEIKTFEEDIRRIKEELEKR